LVLFASINLKKTDQMKRMKSIALMATLMLFLSTITSSCLTTKTSVGAFTETQGNEYTYAKGKQFWLFWGIMPLGRTSVNTPTDGICQVVTKFNFGDALISGLTGGIVTSYSIKITAKKKE
jgi:hypothetical protein